MPRPSAESGPRLAHTTDSGLSSGWMGSAPVALEETERHQQVRLIQPFPSAFLRSGSREKHRPINP